MIMEKNKILIAILLILNIVFIIGAIYFLKQNTFSTIPKGYTAKEEYFDKNGFQDYTDFAKYTYSNKEIITNNKQYRKITEKDIDEIKGYFEDFYKCMDAQNRLNEYKFDINTINEGDYVLIKTKEGKEIGNSQYGKYDNYSVYLFDSETLTLYYIHNNI